MSDDLLDVLTAIGDGALLQTLPDSVADPIVLHCDTRDELHLALENLDVPRSVDADEPVFRLDETRYMTLPEERGDDR
ncbi:hypothetical protein [Halobacterium zhouii]|uniref:hypothetical protein n=1 Tax=Halobacterium zhouii TaxID=2902624 RepID=UPI001E5E5BBE|nr:hypothetical protein [Halobacterium zhouii]